MNAENLLKLASYLEALPEGYREFSMESFHTGVVRGVYCSDDFRPEDIPAAANHPCGTAACAVGHGPSAGLPISTDDRHWDGYSRRVFGIRGDDWEWCFAGEWEEHDNTPAGAAKRIRQLVAGERGELPWDDDSDDDGYSGY